MKPKLVARLLQIKGWRLSTAVSLITVLAAELIVSAMSLLFNGELTHDYLITGLVASGIVAPLGIALMSVLIEEISKSRQQLESNAQTTEKRLNIAIQNAQILIWELDLVTNALRYDDTMLRLLDIAPDIPPHSIQGWLELVHPDDRAVFMANFQAALLSGDPMFDMEYRYARKPDQWGWAHTKGQVIQRDASGSPLLAVGSTMNITGRKHAEHEFRDAQSRFELIFNNNPDVMVISRLPEGIITNVNDAFTLNTGYSKEEAIGNTTVGLAFWNDEERRRMTDAIRKDGYCRGMEFDFTLKDGQKKTGSFSAVVTQLQGIPHLVSTIHDISDRKQMEIALKASESRFRSIIEATPIPLALNDDKGNITYLNTAFQEIIGYSKKEIPTLEQWWIHAYPDPQYRRSVTESWQRALDEARHNHTPLRFMEVNITCKDGSEKIFSVGATALSGDYSGVHLVSLYDITERKQNEVALAETGNLLKTIIDTAPMRVFWKDRDSRYLGCNPIFARDAGLSSPEHLLGKDDHQLSWHAQADLYRADDLQVMKSGIAKVSYDEPQTTPDGHVIWLRTSKVPLRNERDETIGILGIYEDITERKQAEFALQESEKRALDLSTMLRLMCDNVPDMIWAKDMNMNYIFANKAICEQLLGASDTEEPIGRNDLFFALRERSRHPSEPQWHTFGELCQDSDAITLNRGKPAQFDEFGNVRGQFIYLDVHKAPFVNEKGDVIGVVGSARNVTEQKSAEEKLRLAALVLENSSEALLVTDEQNHIMDINPAFSKMTGYERAEIIGKNPAILKSGRQGSDFYAQMWEKIKLTGRWQGEIWNRRKNGDIFAEWLTINTIFHDDGTIHRRVALFSDITEKKKSEELIWTQANFDSLTHLPNRRMFRDRLAYDLKKAHRAGLKLGLLFLDLDRFKEVNDTLGHDAGDLLLIEAARRISVCVRDSDTVARLGGDEFTVILADLEGTGRVEHIAEEIIQSLSQPFDLNGHKAYVTASIGITLYPDDARDIEDMLKNADQAMFVSKRAGRNRFSFFTNAMQEASQHRLHIINDLRAAVAGQQFQLYFQPIIELSSGRLHKAEALLRWFNPSCGLISPAEFIPLAEDSGLIHEIGAWVFAEAVKQAQHWQSVSGPNFQISVNMSPIQMQATHSHPQWFHQLEKTGLSGQNFVIEITEGLLLDTSTNVTNQLLAFRDAGIQVAIDDFGTGYSALSYLKKLDIDYLKIDQSFTRNLAPDSSDMALSEAIIVMAHKLGLKVIAEGVETAQQHQLLLAIGCDYGQGYYYSKPLPKEAFEALLTRG